MTDQSVFDPDTFMESVTTEQGSTTILPAPAGEYNGLVLEVRKPRHAGDNIVMDIIWEILDPELKESLGRTRVTARQSIWLDVTSQNQLDMGKGKNVGLNRLREALGMNSPGQPFTINMLKGAGPAVIRVVQEPDRSSPDIIYNRVNSVGRS